MQESSAVSLVESENKEEIDDLIDKRIEHLRPVDGGEKARKYGGQISGMQWSNKNGRSCLPFLLLH